MGVLSAVVPSSGRFLGGGTKRGRLWVGKWAFVGWRRGVSSEAITKGLAETRLHDVQRLNEQQALQLVDLAQQRDALQARYDRQEAELLELTERLRQQEAVAATEQAAHAQHLRATEDRAHGEIDRARQETKDLRAQLTALARERTVSEQLLRQQREEAVAATVAAQREAGLQRGRAEALEQQLDRLGDLPATRRPPAFSSKAV